MKSLALYRIDIILIFLRYMHHRPVTDEIVEEFFELLLIIRMERN